MLTLFKDKPLEQRKPLVKAMVTRMAAAYAIKKSSLPEQLNCSKSLINNWGYYGRIPYDYLEQCRIDTGASMDWLMYGVKPVKALSAEDVTELHEIQHKVFNDGVNYNMISECYEGAVTQLTDKYQKDIAIWIEKLRTKEVTGKKDD